MKKSIIKRRKRVVAPANGNFAHGIAPAATPQTMDIGQQLHAHNTGSPSDTEMTDVSANAVRQLPNSNNQRFPLAVDFTSTSRTSSSATHNGNMSLTSENGDAAQQQRKRSLSLMDSESPEARSLHSINSLLNPRGNGVLGDVPIEPSLLALGNGMEDLPSDQKRRVLMEKRELLERESKRIRVEIEACDRELERIGTGESVAAVAAAAASLVSNGES
jgi:hypothetical protein